MSSSLRTCPVFAVALVLSLVVVNVVISETVDLVVDFEIPKKIVPKVDFVIGCCRIVKESR